MRRTLALLAAGIAGAFIALVALSLATGALAQGPGGTPAQPTPGTGPYAAGPMMGRGQMAGGRMMAGRDQSLVGMAAAELGISQQELVAQLGADGTIAGALTAGKDNPTAVLDGFLDRFVASRAERLDAAVAAGALTRADADARLATARSMAADRIAQPFTAVGPGGQGAGQGAGFVDENGDGVCDLMPTGGQMQGRMGGGRGPRR